MSGEPREAPSAVPRYCPEGGAWVEEHGQVFLIGAHCRRCAKHSFPYRSRCDQCRSRDATERVPLNRIGTLYSFSTVHVAPKGLPTPYVIGYVDLPEDVRLFGQIDGGTAGLHVGAAVEVILGAVRVAEDGGPVIGYRFRVRRDENGA